MAKLSRRDVLRLAALPPAARAEADRSLVAGETVFAVDPAVVEDHWALRRVVERPVRHPGNPLIRGDRAWEGPGPYLYGTVLRDPASGLYRCWHTLFDAEAYARRLPGSYRAAYCVSDDGLEWRKPSLGQVEYSGSTGNNLLRIGAVYVEGIDVAPVPPECGLDAQFVALYLDKGGLHLALSGDGLRWREHPANPVEPSHSDCHNSLAWDRTRRRWLIHMRPPVFAGPSKRRIAVMESADLKRWSRPEIVLIPEESEPPEIYGMPVFERGGLFFGLPQLYDRTRETIEVGLVYSSDARRWLRAPGREPFLGAGPAGGFDSGMIFTADAPVVVDGRMRFYYGGWDGPHNARDRRAAIGLASVALDRLIGWQTAAREPGFLLTRPIDSRGGRLTVNASAAGSLRAAVLDLAGRPLPGFDFENCRPLRGDAPAAALQWGDRTLPPGACRLKFRLEDGTLYSFAAS